MTVALSNLRVMVPVTEGRRDLTEALHREGATTVEVEFIAIEPPADSLALERAVREWCDGAYAWMAVTSRNAILAMNAMAGSLGVSLVGPMPRAQVAAVGDATRTVCESVGIEVGLVPAIATGRGLVTDFPVGRGNVLVPVGDKASPMLATGIGRKGWDVTSVEAYRTVAGSGPTVAQAHEVATGQVDVVLLTSGAMVTHLVAACPTIHPSTTMVAIGSTTAAAAAAAGLTVAAVADRPTYAALIEGVRRATGRTAS